jgi:hypothetical protein
MGDVALVLDTAVKGRRGNIRPSHGPSTAYRLGGKSVAREKSGANRNSTDGPLATKLH